MNNSGTLITCPACALTGKKPVLGRLLETGDVVILRFHHGTSIIRSSDVYLGCGCGYAVHIANGTIESYINTT